MFVFEEDIENANARPLNNLSPIMHQCFIMQLLFLSLETHFEFRGRRGQISLRYISGSRVLYVVLIFPREVVLRSRYFPKACMRSEGRRYYYYYLGFVTACVVLIKI